MVEHAQDYPWSSFHLRLNETTGNHWLDEDPCFNELGETDAKRRAIYKSFVEQCIPTPELQLIRNALQRSQLTGNKFFMDEVEEITGRRILQRGRGRPQSDSKKPIK